MRCENRRRLQITRPMRALEYSVLSPGGTLGVHGCGEGESGPLGETMPVNRAAVRLQPQYGPSQGADGAVASLMLPTITGWIEQ